MSAYFYFVLIEIPVSKQSGVDEKAMIRNRYNRDPHTALDTKWERDTYKWDGIKIETHRAKMCLRGFSTSYISNQAAQLQKLARILNLWIQPYHTIYEANNKDSMICPRLVLVNRLGGISLPRNSTSINWQAWHDLVVDWAEKPQHKQNIIMSHAMRKWVFGSLRPGKTQTDLLSYRDQLESWNFGYIN